MNFIHLTVKGGIFHAGRSGKQDRRLGRQYHTDDGSCSESRTHQAISGNEEEPGQSAADPHGKQTVKELIGQNAGVSNIEITDKNIKSFEQVARKYGVDYALKKDTTGEKPKYLVFWIFKPFVAVLLVTHTFDIVMGIFDMAQSVVSSASGVISADASVGPIPMATMVNGNGAVWDRIIFVPF